MGALPMRRSGRACSPPETASEERIDRPGKGLGLFAAIGDDQQRTPRGLPEQNRIRWLCRERQSGERDRGARLRRAQVLQRFLKSRMLAQAEEQVTNGWMNQGLRVRISSTIPVVE